MHSLRERRVLLNRKFKVLFIKDGVFLKKALSLRSKVFFEGKKKDEDRFDKVCQHLVVIDRKTKQVIGTYRLLLDSVARKNFGFYSETEFNLKNIRKNCKEEILELGRACVDKAYRNYPLISFMWKEIVSYIEKNKVRFVIGCTSIKESNPEKIGKIFSFLESNFFSPPKFRVYPQEDKRFSYFKNSSAQSKRDIFKMLPSLMKSYLNIGAFVCGEPSWDEIFRTVDFFMMLDVKKMNSSFLRKFL